MKKYLLLFFIATTISAATIYPIQETFWQKLWRCTWHISCYKTQFGTTLTTINGSDQISNSRAVINTNFSNLNTYKIENSTTSVDAITTLNNLSTAGNLATIGTITSGTWNGTTLDIQHGGTASTTLSSNQVLLGNGTSGIKVPAGYGNSGQFLTSNGVGSAPTWTTGSIDGTLNYAFTGSTYIKNLSASSTVANPLILNTVSYSTPSSQGNANTVLRNDGTGALTWGTAPQFTYATTTLINITANGGYATSSKSFVIPASTLNASSTIEMYGHVIVQQGASTGACDPLPSNGTSGVYFVDPTTISNDIVTGANTTNETNFHIIIEPNNSALTQALTVENFCMSQTAGTLVVGDDQCWNEIHTSTQNLNSAFAPVMVMRNNAGNTVQCKLTDLEVIVHP